MKKHKILLFDIDGTLLLTGGAGKPAIEKAFEDLLGIKNAWQNIKPHGRTDPLIFQEIAGRQLNRALSAREMYSLNAKYHEYFEREIEKAADFRLMPGVEDLLKTLSRDTSLHLGIATGNFERAAFLKLKRGNIHHFFKFGGFGSDSEDRFQLTLAAYKRGEDHAGINIMPEQVYVIGDTPFDIQAGKLLGARTIAVATGNASVEKLTQYGPDIALPNLKSSDTFLEFIGCNGNIQPASSQELR